jgi:dTDP-4-dehydrorhamnose reductase
MRIAVTGTTGRVGSALARKLSRNHEVIPLPRSVFDMADQDSLKQTLKGLDCDVFINPAGVTGLEACEDDPSLAMRVNSEVPGEIAEWAASRSVRMMHFSTDYVLGGRTPGLHDEMEPPEPLSVYGRSKYAGELRVLSYPGNLVLRVSWVFGPEKPSFIDQIFESALAGRPLAAVADKFSLPTFTADLTGWVEALVSSDATGLIHACNTGEPVSWHDMAVFTVREMAALGVVDSCPDVLAQKLDEVLSFRAVRPRCSAMDTRKLAGILGCAPRPWEVAVAEYVRDI